MKLLKKLIPFAALGSVATIIVPLTTSCSTVDAISPVLDGFTRYIPAVEQATADKEHLAGYTYAEGLELYYKNISKDPEVLYQDMRASLANDIYEAVQNPKAEKKVEARVKIDYSDLKMAKPEGYKSTLSINTQTDFHVRNFQFPENKLLDLDYNFDADLSLSIKIENFDVQFLHVNSKDNPVYGWCLFSDSLGFDQNKTAEEQLIEMSVNGDIYFNGKGPAGMFHFDNETYTVDENTVYEEIPPKWEFMLTFSSYLTCVKGSYHFANISYNSQ